MPETLAHDDPRRAALEALGLDADIVVLPDVVLPDLGAQRDPPVEASSPLALDDGEWAILRPWLPEEAAQANTLPNRAFLDAVLWLVTRGRAWTRMADRRGEAARKRFARWAHAGVWENLIEHVTGGGLTPAREAQLRTIAVRARGLRQRLSARR